MFRPLHTSALLCAALLTGCGEDKKVAAPPTPPAPASPSTSAAAAPNAASGPSLATKPEVVPAAPLSQEKTPAAAEANKPKAEEKPATAPAAGAAVKTVNVTFGKSFKRTLDLPENWKQEELLNNMRLLQIRVPKHVDDAADGELLVFKFMAAGPVEQNVERWVKQFGGGADALVERKQVKTAAGVDAEVAVVQGTYTGMSPQAGGAERLDPKPDYMMCGAIFTVPDDGDYVFKFVGPKLTVESQKDAFLKMLASFK